MKKSLSHIRWFFWFAILSLPAGLWGQDSFDFRIIDSHASKAPEHLKNDLELLVDYLASPAQSDYEVARAFFVWIGKNIKYDRKAAKNSDMSYNYRVEEILDKQRAVCTGFSTLFKQMCLYKGIRAEVISGYSKGTLTARSNPVEPDHAWNGVELAGQWYLLDVTWGAGLSNYEGGSKDLISDEYFLSNPDQFILDHMPAMPMWQLLDCPIPIEKFGFAPEVSLESVINKAYCFEFADSISRFTSMLRIEQRLEEAKHTFRFHPTKENAYQLAHSYLDHAATLVDSSEQYVQAHNMDQLILLQEQILLDCQKAEAITELHTWQKEMYIHTLINHTAALFNRTEQNVLEDKVFYTDLLENLEKAKIILGKTEETYFTKAADKQCDEFLNLISNYVKDDE